MSGQCIAIHSNCCLIIFNNVGYLHLKGRVRYYFLEAKYLKWNIQFVLCLSHYTISGHLFSLWHNKRQNPRPLLGSPNEIIILNYVAKWYSFCGSAEIIIQAAIFSGIIIIFCYRNGVIMKQIWLKRIDSKGKSVIRLFKNSQCGEQRALKYLLKYSFLNVQKGGELQGLKYDDESNTASNVPWICTLRNNDIIYTPKQEVS